MGMLDTNFIMSEEEIDNLFNDSNELETQALTPPSEEEGSSEQENTKDTTEEKSVDVENLFDFANPESVGSEVKDKESKSKGKENTASTEGADISPNTNNFYSSYAKALKVDGIFQNLSDDEIDSITDAETFEDAMQKEVDSRFQGNLKRINEALQARVEPSVIGLYENTLKQLDSISELILTDEGEDGLRVRSNLIYLDYINRGFSKERAQREVKKSFELGNDVDDAKEALESCKEFYNSKYEALIKEAKEEEAREKESRRKEVEKLKKSILETTTFGDVELDKATRLKVYDNITRPIYKDPETGEYLTAIQKYELENRLEFLKNFGYYFTLTDGFKNMDALVKGKVKKGIRNGMKEFENSLRQLPKPIDGNMRYMGGSNDTTADSFLNGKFKLDI